MTLTFDMSTFVRTINFYKKQKNYVDILETAANNVADEILNDAKDKVYQKLKRRTGSIADTLKVIVATSDNTVSLKLGASHPASAIIEYGGYSPFPPWGSSSGLPFPVAKKIYENQPFAEPRPFLRPALQEGVGKFEGEVIRVANKMKP